MCSASIPYDIGFELDLPEMGKTIEINKAQIQVRGMEYNTAATVHNIQHKTAATL
jgi:hypothetical protein